MMDKLTMPYFLPDIIKDAAYKVEESFAGAVKNIEDSQANMINEFINGLGDIICQCDDNQKYMINSSINEELCDMNNAIIMKLDNIEDKLDTIVSDMKSCITISEDIQIFMNGNNFADDGNLSNLPTDSLTSSQTDGESNTIIDYINDLLLQIRNTMFETTFSLYLEKLIKSGGIRTLGKEVLSGLGKVLSRAGLGTEIAGLATELGGVLSAILPEVLLVVAAGVLTGVVLYSVLNSEKFTIENYNNAVSDFFSPDTPYEQFNPDQKQINPVSQAMIDLFSIKTPSDNFKINNKINNGETETNNDLIEKIITDLSENNFPRFSIKDFEKNIIGNGYQGTMTANNDISYKSFEQRNVLSQSDKKELIYQDMTLPSLSELSEIILPNDGYIYIPGYLDGNTQTGADKQDRDTIDFDQVKQLLMNGTYGTELIQWNSFLQKKDGSEKAQQGVPYANTSLPSFDEMYESAVSFFNEKGEIGSRGKIDMNAEDVSRLNLSAGNNNTRIVYNTLEPNITINFENVYQTADINKLIPSLNRILREEISIAGEG